MSFLSLLFSGTSTFCLNDGYSPGKQAKPGDLTELMAELQQAGAAETTRLVDYPAIEARLGPARESLYKGLLGFNPDTLETREETLAFWVNLYNVLIVDAVLTFRVRKSVVGLTRGLLRFFEKAAYRVSGQRFSGNDIEHGLLRGNQGHPLSKEQHFPIGDLRRKLVVAPLEPRIHFALNCASHSCPPFRAFIADQIESQLTLATRSFVDSETQIQGEPPQLILSTIFKWYPEDFEASGGIVPFLVEHLPVQDQRHQFLKESRDNLQLSYSPYNWKLNSLLPS